MRQTGFKGDFPAFLHFLRTDPRFYAKTPDELLKDAAWIAKTFDGKAATWFGHLPRRRFAIVPVPAAIAPFYTAGRGGDGRLSGQHLRPAEPPALPADRADAARERARPRLPDPARRREQGPAAVPHRWLYLGLWRGLGALLRAAGRRDGHVRRRPTTGSACSATRCGAPRGWWSIPASTISAGRRAQAIAFLHDNTALSDHEIETEVDRYISWPGQALSYYLGEKTIRDDRARAEKALGPKFNIRAFHDAILELGSVPMSVVDARIDQFIAEGGKGPYPDEE